jgi:hypothetical protein
MPSKKLAGRYGGGVNVLYNWMTRGYIVMWHDSIIAMPSSREECEGYLAWLGKDSPSDVSV